MIDPPSLPDPDRTVLLVEDVASVREGLCALLSRSYSVRFAAGAEEAEAMLERGPRPRVLLTDYQLPGRDGAALLRRVKERWPEVVGVMLTGNAELDVALRAVHEGGAFRFLCKPCHHEALRRALDEAMTASETALERERVAGELRFSRESLVRFNRELEERVITQTDRLRRLHAFAVDLNRARGLREPATLAAEVVHEVLGGRGVHVQVWDRDDASVEASLGPEMSARMHRAALETCDGPVGELVVDELGPDGEALSRTDVEFVASVASSAAVAVHNELRRAERDEAQYATIVALARLSEQRDNETGKHLERVSEYCRVIAEGLRDEPEYAAQVDDTFVGDLVRSAPLHDIGKVGIPDSILMKPGALSDSEWEVMKTHSAIGAQTLDSVIRSGRNQGFLEMARDIAAHHHEKWDGSGYPSGLAGEEIPLSARILSVADVYDALTTVRPYKAAWSHREALAYVQEHAGTQFDPALVRSLLRRGQAVDEIRARLADSLDEPVEDARRALPRTA